MKYLDLDKEEIKTWIILGLIFTILLIIAIFGLNIKIHDLFGVDTQITDVKYSKEWKS
jgi:hypothetical protein